MTLPLSSSLTWECSPQPILEWLMAVRYMEHHKYGTLSQDHPAVSTELSPTLTTIKKK